MLGTSAMYRTPRARVNPASTSAVPAICGTQAGLTNAPTSITGSPAADRWSTNPMRTFAASRARSF
jgi:hypothetical protein